MKFRITRHSTASPPPDALDLLGAHVERRFADVRFTHVGPEIRANVSREDALGHTSDELSEIERREVLELVGEICERAPELKLDWYAVSPAR
jgi:hypothetical protein